MLKDLLYVHPTKESILRRQVRFHPTVRKTLKGLGTALRKPMALLRQQKKDAGKPLALTAQDLRWVYGHPEWRVATFVEYNHLMDSFFPGWAQQVEGLAGKNWVETPWEKEAWFRESVYWSTHFLHMSEKTPGMVAYAETAEKFIADRYTVVKPGRYLTKFFGDVLTEGDIRTWAEKCAQKLLDTTTLHFKDHGDKDGWVEVYTNGPSSCMSGGGDASQSVEVYAHSESVLRLAYMEEDGNPIARCIVRDDLKQYIRIYPGRDADTTTYNRMLGLLQAAGYGERGNLDGVKLDKVEGSCGYLMPYLDTGAGGTQNVAERGGYFVVDSCGSYCANNTNGYLVVGEECAECGADGFDEDDLYYVENEDIRVCECCINRHFITANTRHGTDYFRDNSEDVIYCESNGEYYTHDAAERNEIYACAVTGEYHRLDDLVSTAMGLVYVDEAQRLDEPHRGEYDYAPTNDAVQTHDGRWIHEDDAVTTEVRLVHHKDDTQLDIDLTSI